VQDQQLDVAAEIDLVAFLQDALDAPFATELLVLQRLGARDLGVLAHEPEVVATVLVDVLFAVRELGVEPVHVNAGAADFLHLAVAARVVGVDVRVDDDPQIGRVPADLRQRWQQPCLGDARGAGVDERPTRRVDEIAVDDAAVFEGCDDCRMRGWIWFT
jgi:hypothetical protein